TNNLQYLTYEIAHQGGLFRLAAKFLWLQLTFRSRMTIVLIVGSIGMSSFGNITVVVTHILGYVQTTDAYNDNPTKSKRAQIIPYRPSGLAGVETLTHPRTKYYTRIYQKASSSTSFPTASE